jgi:tetratricopeptide (TPR) repeat protein
MATTNKGGREPGPTTRRPTALDNGQQGRTIMMSRTLLAIVLTLGLVSTALAAGSSSSSSKPARPTTYNQGVKAVKAGDYARALGLLQKVVQGSPNNADAWNYIGFSHRNLKQFDQSLAAYRKALAIDPDHRGANEYLGELYLQTGDLTKAKERLAKLDDLCTFGCEEYDDLKQAIKTYEAAKKSG